MNRNCQSQTCARASHDATQLASTPNGPCHARRTVAGPHSWCWRGAVEKPACPMNPPLFGCARPRPQSQRWFLCKGEDAKHNLRAMSLGLLLRNRRCQAHRQQCSTLQVSSTTSHEQCSRAVFDDHKARSRFSINTGSLAQLSVAAQQRPCFFPPRKKRSWKPM